jgi:hypothetical protein
MPSPYLVWRLPNGSILCLFRGGKELLKEREAGKKTGFLPEIMGLPLFDEGIHFPGF